MVGGTLGGAIAHEFMHAPHTVERVVGAGLMSLMTYGHFTIGHVAGHHRVGGDDRGSRRPPAAGKACIAFLVRSFAGGVDAGMACRGDREARRRDRGAWSVDNRLLQIVGWQAACTPAIYSLRAGWA